MLNKLINLLRQDDTLSKYVLNEISQNDPDLTTALDNALNQKQSVKDQYEKRIAACEIIILKIGLEHELTNRILDVKEQYKNDLAEYESKLCVRIKKLFGF